VRRLGASPRPPPTPQKSADAKGGDQNGDGGGGPTSASASLPAPTRDVMYAPRDGRAGPDADGQVRVRFVCLVCAGVCGCVGGCGWVGAGRVHKCVGWSPRPGHQHQVARLHRRWDAAAARARRRPRAPLGARGVGVGACQRQTTRGGRLELGRARPGGRRELGTPGRLEGVLAWVGEGGPVKAGPQAATHTQAANLVLVRSPEEAILAPSLGCAGGLPNNISLSSRTFVDCCVGRASMSQYPTGGTNRLRPGEKAFREVQRQFG
jgi:hypothetical protein